MELRFTKMHGTGNDFVMVEDLAGDFDFTPEAARWLCDRHFGIGADGLIVVKPATREGADFYMHYVNSDGSLAEMCGNGARCFAAFVVDRGLVPADASELVIDTLGGLRPVTFTRNADGTAGLVTIDMGVPVLDAASVPAGWDAAEVVDEPIETPWGNVSVTAVSMGNPHAIIWVDDPDEAPVETVGPFIETHERFPNRTNVEFAQVVDSSRIRLRVWERGCGETLACGTGACATVVAAVRAGMTNDRVTVELPGGELTIAWDGAGSVLLTGPTATVFAGSMELEEG